MTGLVRPFGHDFRIVSALHRWCIGLYDSLILNPAYNRKDRICRGNLICGLHQRDWVAGQGQDFRQHRSRSRSNFQLFAAPQSPQAVAFESFGPHPIPVTVAHSESLVGHGITHGREVVLIVPGYDAIAQHRHGSRVVRVGRWRAVRSWCLPPSRCLSRASWSRRQTR